MRITKTSWCGVLVGLIVAIMTGCSGGAGGTVAQGPGTNPTPTPTPNPTPDPGLDTGIGGSGGRIVGTFQGVGSIIINDRTLTTADAEFEIEDGTDETDLSEGQRLLVFADLTESRADTVIYRSDIKGPITAVISVDPLIGTAELQILGQTVRANAVTRFSGTTLAALSVGSLVEVSGARNADGELVATYIERDATLTEYKTIGTVQNLDAGLMRFDLEGLSVDYSSATLSEFEGTAIANGLVVEVKLDAADFTAPDAAVASEVERLTTVAFEDGDDVEYEGFIDQFVSAADFSIEGLPVTTGAATQYVNGDAASLGRNVKVEAEGVIDADGVLVAARIIVKPTGAVRVEGTVESVDITAGTVTMSVGISFQIRALTELEDDRDDVEPFTLADIQTGPNADYLEVRGFLDGQTLVAAELERDDFDTRTRFRGPVTAEDPEAGTVDILDVTITGVEGVTDYPGSQAQFHAEVEVGTFIEAEWDPFTSSMEPANELSIEDD